MKKLSVFICVQLWLIVSCFSISAQDFQKIRDGIEHAKITRQMKSAGGKDENVVFNLLRLDLRKVRLDVVHAFDRAIGLEKTSSIAARHGAFAAINAGFFRLDKSIFAGDAAGALMIDRKVLSESYASRSALLIRNERQKTIADFQYLDLNVLVAIGNQELSVSGINRERRNDELILFTPEFNRTTLTNIAGLEITVQNGKIIRILDRKGSSSIPANGFILSATGKSREELLKQARPGAKVVVSQPITYTKLDGKPAFIISEYEDIVGGVPSLIRFGKIEITWEQEKSSKVFVETRHPRTAVAKLKDGKFLMVTVDGRSKESGGISLPDLAAFLLELGATDAMNLDGGGSTTMFLDGRVVNKPSDKEGERAVGDAILVFPRK
jgi:exopolysaccharide biosynthesis protein